jgi:tRNA dimethylallyltransferase
LVPKDGKKVSDKRPVVVVCGATATGKTALALALASYYSLEVLSADARQVYADMEGGTAAPTAEQRAAVPHHFVATLRPGQEWTAALFAREAHMAIDAMPLTTLPMVVGGAGLYITALTDGLSPELEPTPANVRLAVQRIMDLEGKDVAWERLYAVDRAAAELYADKNPRRIQRALEYHATTGRRISDTWSVQRHIPPYSFTRIGLTMPREELYHAINERCRAMVPALLAETQSLLDAGLSSTDQCMQTVGYAQATLHIQGTLSFQEMLNDFQQATRRYAKRQETWFKRDDRITWFDALSTTLVQDVDSFLRAQGLQAYCLTGIP